MKRWFVGLLLLAVPLLLVATTVIPMGVEALTRASSHVVEVRAMGKHFTVEFGAHFHLYLHAL